MSDKKLQTFFEKKYGKGTVFTGKSRIVDVDVLPTGILSLDDALGVGGLPRGRIIEIYGPEASGKTTIALSIIAAAQREGGRVGFVDTEYALDADWAEKNGVSVTDMFISQPDDAEQALAIVNDMVETGEFSVVVLDSVAALAPRAELEGEMGDSHVGLVARLMSQAMRKLTSTISRKRCIVVFLNQVREKIGVMFGNPETTTGGRALRFYASVRMEVRRSGHVKNGNDIVGMMTKVKIVKNKVASPYRETELKIDFANGIDRKWDLVNTAISHGVIKRSGSWYYWGEEKLAQGMDNVLFVLDDEKMEAIRSQVINKTKESLDGHN